MKKPLTNFKNTAKFSYTSFSLTLRGRSIGVAGVWGVDMKVEAAGGTYVRAVVGRAGGRPGGSSSWGGRAGPLFCYVATACLPSRGALPGTGYIFYSV